MATQDSDAIPGAYTGLNAGYAHMSVAEMTAVEALANLSQDWTLVEAVDEDTETTLENAIGWVFLHSPLLALIDPGVQGWIVVHSVREYAAIAKIGVRTLVAERDRYLQPATWDGWMLRHEAVGICPSCAGHGCAVCGWHGDAAYEGCDCGTRWQFTSNMGHAVPVPGTGEGCAFCSPRSYGGE